MTVNHLTLTTLPSLAVQETREEHRKILEAVRQRRLEYLYKNPSFGYFIKYPLTWRERVNCEGQGASEDKYICFLSPDFDEGPSGAIMGATNKGSLIIIKSEEDLVGNSSDLLCKQEKSMYISNPCKEITIGKQLGWQRKISPSWLRVGIPQNGKFILSLDVIYNNNLNEKETRHTFYQILSTLKITVP